MSGPATVLRSPDVAHESRRRRAADARASSAGGWAALLAICAAGALLYTWRLGEGSFGNTYYTAAVRSMLESPTNLLFGAADPHGVVSVDKPPLALWPQALSVRLFGFTTWALFLPQVLAAIATLVLLHRTVRRWAGEAAALIAAAVMALSPVIVVLARDNNTDTLLILFLVAAAYALTRSLGSETERGRRAWLLGAAALVGLAFNTKMLEAWIVAPAMAAAYLLGTGVPLRARLLDLVRAAAVLLPVSFAWMALRDLWPGAKPYMGGSTTDSAFELAFGYNGFGALLGTGQNAGGSGLDVPLAVVGLFGGSAGADRLFSAETGGQIAWLLPFCGVALAYAGARAYLRAWHGPTPGTPERGGWALWSGWLLCSFLVLSFTSGIFNTYYVSLMVPAVAAVTGAAAVLLWRRRAAGDRVARAVLAAGVAVTSSTAVGLIGRAPEWHGWTRWAVVAAGVLAIGLIVAPAVRRHALGLSVVVIALVAGPAVWSVGTAAAPPDGGGFPQAGPPNERFDAMRRGEMIPTGLEDLPLGAPVFASDEEPPELPAELLALTEREHTGPVRAGGFAGHELSPENARVLEHAEAGSTGRPIALLVEGGGLASSEFIIDSDAVVVGMGGFLGADPVPTTDVLDAWLADGTFRYVLSAAPGGPRIGGIAGMGGVAAERRIAWVDAHCAVVPAETYGGTTFGEADDLPIPSYGDSTLYDCHPAG